MIGYPRWFPAGLHLVVALLIISGLLLVPTALSFRLDCDLPWRLGGEQRLLVAAAHTTASFLGLAVLGALMSIHARVGWRHGGNRGSGMILCATLVGLMLSSLGLFYFGEDDAARLSCLAHLGLAAILIVTFGWHVPRGRALARQRARR